MLANIKPGGQALAGLPWEAVGGGGRGGNKGGNEGRNKEGKKEGKKEGNKEGNKEGDKGGNKEGNKGGREFEETRVSTGRRSQAVKGDQASKRARERLLPEEG